jgi:hypothetical protein
MVDKRPFALDAGTIFPPTDNPKEAGARVDFRTDISFRNLVEWHGVRWAWTRMTICPCKGFNDQTGQTDPHCAMCNGLGWAPIKTPGYYMQAEKVGVLNEEQQELIRRNNSMLIRGVATSMTSQPNMFGVLGPWALGNVMITVRAENKLGYYDRLCYLDDVMPFSEVITLGDSATVKTRYPVAALNAVISSTTVYTEKDVWLDKGALSWVDGHQPVSGTRISVSYMCHPVFVVIDYAHLIRTMPVRAKLPRAQQLTPMGETLNLPLQVIARLEHLPLETRAP